jgi:hypothetical protein
MPVTARLSQKFYERFGDDLTNGLVDWLNQVDATYRSDWRELNELNFARFEARLDQRVAQLEGRIEAALGRLEGRLLARIGMAEGRQARLTLTLWVATLATVVALLKL